MINNCMVVFLHREIFVQVKYDNLILYVQYTADPPQANSRLTLASVDIMICNEQYLCKF